MALIEMENVEVFYDDFQALKGVSCAIEGGAVGLLGPNGAGKSTMMKTFLGFNRATSGTVRILGHDMPGGALQVRQQMGYMPEREAVSPNISAVSFLTYCGELLGMTRIDARERCHEVLNYVGLGESRYRNMETFSTGMLQRTKLAQALIHDPKILLLDEPTNGLDPESRLEMLELVRDLAYNRKVTVLLSSHLLPDVQHVCEYILIIDKGQVVRHGALSDLTAMQEQHYEVRVRENKNRYMDALIQAGFQCRETKNGDLLVIQPPEGTPRDLFRLARDCDTQVRHYRQARESLSDVFMDAIGKES